MDKSKRKLPRQLFSSEKEKDQKVPPLYLPLYYPKILKKAKSSTLPIIKIENGHPHPKTLRPGKGMIPMREPALFWVFMR